MAIASGITFRSPCHCCDNPTPAALAADFASYGFEPFDTFPGYVGFFPPGHVIRPVKYLTATIHMNDGGGHDWTQTISFGRHNGGLGSYTNTGDSYDSLFIPSGASKVNLDAASIARNYIKFVTNYNPAIVFEITLSDEYTLVHLKADVEELYAHSTLDVVADNHVLELFWAGYDGSSIALGNQPITEIATWPWGDDFSTQFVQWPRATTETTTADAKVLVEIDGGGWTAFYSEALHNQCDFAQLIGLVVRHVRGKHCWQEIDQSPGLSGQPFIIGCAEIDSDGNNRVHLAPPTLDTSETFNDPFFNWDHIRQLHLHTLPTGSGSGCSCV